ncbi:MAG: hypothetical protein DDT32_01451 [Syntrophomonadaceae bacterium]|nr:hypothetical protein [Bacillota bacterium]
MLRLFDFRPLEVYNALDQAYDIRSTFIHGSQIKSEEHKSTTELANRVLEYARISLLIFLQLKSLVDKDNFVSKIDNALLDENAYLKLKELVKSCTIYQ